MFTSIILRFDAALLDLCTRFSHFLQRTVGLTNYFLARVGFFIYVLSLLANVSDYWFHFLKVSTPLPFMVLMVLILPGVYLAVWETYRIEEDLYRTGSVRLHGLLRIGTFFGRIAWFVFTVITALSFWRQNWTDFLVAIAWPFGMTIVYYFLSVTPLPPSVSGVRKFVDSFFRVAKEPKTAEVHG